MHIFKLIEPLIVYQDIIIIVYKSSNIFLRMYREKRRFIFVGIFGNYSVICKYLVTTAINR